MDSPLYEILTIVGIFGAYKFGKYEGINQKIKEEADNAEEKTESNEEKLFNLVSAAAKNVTLDKPSFRNELGNTAYADHIRTASRLTSGHSAEVDSYTLPIYIRTI